MDKKAIRAAFRRAVFTRDKLTCRCCGRAGQDRQGTVDWKLFHKVSDPDKLVTLDAHHIINRNWFDNGGYVAENGVSVCDTCHLKAEAYWQGEETDSGFLPEDLYKIIGSDLDKAIEADAKLAA